MFIFIMADSPKDRTSNQENSAGKNLSSCLFSQYALTVAGVTGGTGYALYKRPKNGVGIMVVSGVAGSMADLAYGWNVACRKYVEAWRQHEIELQRQKEEESKRKRSEDNQ